MQREIRLRWLLTGALLSSIGMSFIWPLTSIYLHNRLHISLTVIGVVLLLNSLGSVIGSIVGGRLYDQSDPFRLTLFGVGLTGIVLIGLTIWHGWPAYCFGWHYLVSAPAGTLPWLILSAPVYVQKMVDTSLPCSISRKTSALLSAPL